MILALRLEGNALTGSSQGRQLCDMVTGVLVGTLRVMSRDL